MCFWRVAVQKKSEEKKFFLNVTDKMKGEWFGIVMDSVMQWVYWIILSSDWVGSFIMLFNPALVISALVAGGGSQRLSLLLGIASWICGKEVEDAISSCCRHCYSETAEDVFFQVQASTSAFCRDQHLIFSVIKLPS